MAVETHATQRIIIVSNRLPFSIEQQAGGIDFKISSGGVATGLKSLLDSMPVALPFEPDYLWVGWPGATVNEEHKAQVVERSRAEFRAHPVFLSEEDGENFYQGFCNKTIWPLFHYFPSNAEYQEHYWNQYRSVNRVFCDTLLSILRPDDLVWIHDYHLMLLPDLLRKAVPKIRIGFFLHIPFPQFEIFRLLPALWRRDLLDGLLGADLVGFHTHDDTKYFLGCVQRILGYKQKIAEVILDRRTVKVSAFPMGIDFKKFHQAAQSAPVLRDIADSKAAFGDIKIVLSVDRQDYSKGIIHRLEGFETLLDTQPQWRGKVTLLMLVVPSRIGIQDYERTKHQLEELVGRINGKFATINWSPILYQYRAVPFESLVALYAMSDVALVTPLRDGMNLVAKEYIACRTDKTGVLILSEMAGSAKELSDALLINPNHREEIAAALQQALAMPRHEQIERIRLMQARLRRHTVARWATGFLQEIFAAESSLDVSYAKPLDAPTQKSLIQHYDRSPNRLLMLDYDGTLVSFASHPQLAKPSRQLLNCLHRLGANPRNELVLLSGRDKDTLENWFGTLPIGLVAEHGAWIREYQQPWQLLKPLRAGWKSTLLPLFQSYMDRVSGAWIEEKEFSLVWHFRDADAQRGMLAGRELTDDLIALTANIDVQVVQGNKTVEVRNAGVNKGLASQTWLSKNPCDFIVAIGDDLTDEDMFTVLPARAYSIRVGNPPTRARFLVRGPEQVFQLLESLIDGEYLEAFQQPDTAALSFRDPCP
jgi:trehalose 6-phosphate synthase/phosphatase